MSELQTFDEIRPGDVDAVGGKGLSLARLAAAGLPVPPGFCVTSAAYRRLRGSPPATDRDLSSTIAAAYRRLGGGLVAVRSSATAEDGAVTSFAGQQETILGVSGESAVCEAVGRCWASLHTERAVAYRRDRGISDEGQTMAVVVQRLIDAEVAGVLFTHDPLDPEGQQMLVEASWGLGESVVSGKVTPDRFHIDRDTGQLLDQHISIKSIEVTAAGEQAVPAERRDRPCLDERQLVELAELGRKVERLYGEPRDIEWAWAEGRFWLLQARPITAAGAAEREQVRREEVRAAASLAESGGTVWSQINLSETLPEPTPMTWAIVRRFTSGKGGLGLMYRDLGYRPAADLDEVGIFDLIAGRTYCHRGREPRLCSSWLPLVPPFAALKAAPPKALDPDLQAVPDPSRIGAASWLLLPLRLPAIIIRSIAVEVRRSRLTQTFASRFRNEILPPFLEETRRAAAEDLTRLGDAALGERLEHWIRRTLYEFARDSLKPTALAALARLNIKRWLQRKLGVERGREAVNELSMRIRPDPEADIAGALRDLMEGRLDRAAFLARFGQRGPQEMELASPRWIEDPESLERLPVQPAAQASEGETPAACWERIAAEAKLSDLARTALNPQVQALHTYLGQREAAKHYLMQGYARIRAVLVEFDRRYRLQGGVFYLTPEELPRLAAGEDLAPLIAERRRRRSVCLSLEAPPVLFSDDLEALGRTAVVEGADHLQGVPLSAGATEARALVLDVPRLDDLPAEPYILVCPSTDPAWVPLFVRARGLVMERGGVLSHGAIVAREYGLPAVAGLPGVQRRLKTGQRLRVDGGRGTVTVLS
jgi:pyruvate,water dikinase